MKCEQSIYLKYWMFVYWYFYDMYTLYLMEHVTAYSRKKLFSWERRLVNACKIVWQTFHKMWNECAVFNMVKRYNIKEKGCHYYYDDYCYYHLYYGTWMLKTLAGIINKWIPWKDSHIYSVDAVELSYSYVYCALFAYCVLRLFTHHKQQKKSFISTNIEYIFAHQHIILLRFILFYYSAIIAVLSNSCVRLKLLTAYKRK